MNTADRTNASASATNEIHFSGIPYPTPAQQKHERGLLIGLIAILLLIAVVYQLVRIKRRRLG